MDFAELLAWANIAEIQRLEREKLMASAVRAGFSDVDGYGSFLFEINQEIEKLRGNQDEVIKRNWEALKRGIKDV